MKYDVFISYAIEDKEKVAQPLADMLMQKGLQVFFAGKEFEIGDKISHEVPLGLKQSRNYVIIISRNYKRYYTLGELFYCINREQQKHKHAVFPIWHNITYDEVVRDYTEVGNHYALSTEHGLEQIADAIVRKTYEGKKKRRNRWLMYIMLAAVFCCSWTLPFAYASRRVPGQNISARELKRLLVQRVTAFQSHIDAALQQEVALANGTRASIENLKQSYLIYRKIGKSNQHQFTFNTDEQRFTTQTQLRNNSISTNDDPSNAWNMLHPEVYLLTERHGFNSDTNYYAVYLLAERAPCTYDIESIYNSENELRMNVHFTNSIRYIKITYLSRVGDKRKRIMQISMKGYLPGMVYSIRNVAGRWEIHETL